MLIDYNILCINSTPKTSETKHSCCQKLQLCLVRKPDELTLSLCLTHTYPISTSFWNVWSFEYLPCSQCSPVHPSGHWHKYDPFTLAHNPPFWQTNCSHSFTSVIKVTKAVYTIFIPSFSLNVYEYNNGVGISNDNTWFSPTNEVAFFADERYLM